MVGGATVAGLHTAVNGCGTLYVAADPLVAGSYQTIVRVTDGAGLTQTCVSDGFTADLTGPSAGSATSLLGSVQSSASMLELQLAGYADAEVTGHRPMAAFRPACLRARCSTRR